jgi:hypothetical protein
MKYILLLSLIITSAYADIYYENHMSCDDTKEVGNALKRKDLMEKNYTEKKYPKRKNNRKLASIDNLYSKLGSSGCNDMTRSEVDSAVSIIRRLNGTIVSPYDYDNNLRGLSDYLRDTGVRMNYFSAAEMVRPHRPAKAKACGNGSELMPSQCRWVSGAVQAMIASEMRVLVGSSISIRNWWRPSCYNKAVSGARKSDHIQARGFDLDFKSDNARAKAQKWLCDFYKEKPFNLQTGIGRITLHIGVGSPRGSRYWTYGSLKSGGVQKRASGDNCWVIKNGTKSIYTNGGSLNL